MALAEATASDSLSREEARAIIVRAQGLGADSGLESAPQVLRHLGAVQLDTISVLARSHELVAYARLGPVPRAEVEAAYWSEPATAFEYTGHAACIMPIELWPYFAFRRRAVRAREQRRLPAEVYEEVTARLREGPITTTDLGGARGRAGWWDWSPVKMAIEGLLRRGEVTVTVRRGWKRVYDLPERALPPELLASEPSDDECYTRLVALATRALGVATAGDIANYFNLTTTYAGVPKDPRRLVRQSIEAAGLVPVQVEGWPELAFAHPDTLQEAQTPASRTTLLSPFDSLIWATQRSGELKERERIRRVFGFSYSFEAYVPEAKRVHGYFTMPLLASSRLVGRVDPVRRGKTLVARKLSLEDESAVPAMARALREAAAWVGCDGVELGDVKPGELRAELARAL